MTQEEKQQHANDISNRIIPCFLEDSTVSELKKLNIQDLIIIINNASWAEKKKIFILDADKEKRFNERLALSRELLCADILDAESIYIFYDKVTHLPFISDDDEIFVFSEKKYADYALDYFRQQMRDWDSVKVKNEDIKMVFSNCFFYCGVKTILLDNGQNYTSINAEGLIEKPDYTEKTEIETPIENPEYFNAVIKLMEELYWRGMYEEKETFLHKKEDTMIIKFNEARFLVPVKGLDSLVHPDPSTDKDSITIPSFAVSCGNSSESEEALPVFTDWNEFTKVYSKKEWSGWVVKPDDLKALIKERLVMNPGSLCFVIDTAMLRGQIEIYNKELKNTQADKPQKKEQKTVKETGK